MENTVMMRPTLILLGSIVAMGRGRQTRRFPFAAVAALAMLGCTPPVVDTEKDGAWRAIVAFTDTEAVSEDWNWFLQDIRDAADRAEAAEGVEIQIIHAGPDVKTVVIGPEDAPLARIDIDRKAYPVSSGCINIL